jgi:hypothetical protein
LDCRKCFTRCCAILLKPSTSHMPVLQVLPGDFTTVRRAQSLILESALLVVVPQCYPSTSHLPVLQVCHPLPVSVKRSAEQQGQVASIPTHITHKSRATRHQVRIIRIQKDQPEPHHGSGILKKAESNAPTTPLLGIVILAQVQTASALLALDWGVIYASHSSTFTLSTRPIRVSAVPYRQLSSIR